MIDEELRSKVLEILESEQNQLKGCLEPQTDVAPPETIPNIEAQTNPDGTLSEKATEEETNYVSESIDSQLRYKYADDAETLYDFCKIVDDEIISINSQINSKKQEIVTLSAEAISRNCWPGIAYSTVGSQIISAYYGEDITLNNDIEKLRIYLHLAGPDVRYDVQNPFEPDKVIKLTDTYSGYGYKNLKDPIVYKNNDGTRSGLLTDGSGSSLGIGRFDVSETLTDHNPSFINPFKLYNGATGTNAPATCVGIGTSVRLLYDEIIALRTKRDSLRNDLNTIKTNKTEKETSAWGIQRINAQIEARQTKNAAAIAAVKNFNTDVTVNVEALVLNLDVGEPDSYSGIGTTWYDLSGYGNNATLFPTSTPASYEYADGNYLTFNGTDQYTQTGIKTTNALGVGNTWMIESWFRINDVPSNIFNSVVSTAGTIAPVAGIITGISTSGISVGQDVKILSNFIGAGTTVTAIGIGSVYINPRSINVGTSTNTTFEFGEYREYANTIVDVNASSTTTNMLGVSYGQSGIFSGVTSNRLIYTVSSGIGTTTLVGSEVETGTWNQGVIVRNGTDSTVLYLNGVGVATYSGDVTSGAASTTKTKIAAWTDESIFSNVSVSIVKIYQKSFTDAEVKDKFDALKRRFGIVG